MLGINFGEEFSNVGPDELVLVVEEGRHHLVHEAEGHRRVG